MPHSKRSKRKLPRHPFWQADKPYLHDHTITDARFRRLGYMMAFSAGAINAGGFFAVSSYTSHVTGTLSRIADNIMLHDWRTVLVAGCGVLCFLSGSILANLTVLWGKRHHFRSCYGLPMWIEAVLLLLFGVFGIALPRIGAAMLPPTFLLPRARPAAMGRTGRQNHRVVPTLPQPAAGRSRRHRPFPANRIAAKPRFRAHPVHLRHQKPHPPACRRPRHCQLPPRHRAAQLPARNRVGLSCQGTGGSLIGRAGLCPRVFRLPFGEAARGQQVHTLPNAAF